MCIILLPPSVNPITFNKYINIISLSLSDAVVTMYTTGSKLQITPFCTQKAHTRMNRTVLIIDTENFSKSVGLFNRYESIFLRRETNNCITVLCLLYRLATVVVNVLIINILYYIINNTCEHDINLRVIHG